MVVKVQQSSAEHDSKVEFDCLKRMGRLSEGKHRWEHAWVTAEWSKGLSALFGSQL